MDGEQIKHDHKNRPEGQFQGYSKHSVLLASFSEELSDDQFDDHECPGRQTEPREIAKRHPPSKEKPLQYCESHDTSESCGA